MIASPKTLLPLVVILLIAGFAGGLVVGRYVGNPAQPDEVASLKLDHEREGHGRGVDSEAGPSHLDSQTTVWTCSMHPHIRLPEPGQCPICFMDLIPLREDLGSAGERVLAMSEEARKLAEIQSSQVERKFVTAELRMVGKIAYDERRVNTISAWIPGRIDRLHVDFTGIRVNKGDHLALLYSPDLLTAQAELLEARKRVGDGYSGQSEFLKKSAVNTLESAREKLRLWGLTEAQISEIEERGTSSDRITIHAPDGGIVVGKYVNEGDYVQTGAKLVTIADLTHLWILMDAYESDLPYIRYAQDVQVMTEAYPGEVFTGRISFIHPELDERTRTAKVRVSVGNPDLKLKPGMFVRAIVYSRLAKNGKVVSPNLAGKWISPMHPEIIKDSPGSCDICGMPLVPAQELGFVSPESGEPPVVVPVSAVLKTGKRAVVYVDLIDQEVPTFEGREVVLGPRAGNHYIVESGLKEGEWVVVNGNFKIDSSLQIQARPSMMSPDWAGAESNGEEADLRAARHARLSSTGSIEALVSLTPVYDAYFQVQKALAEDDFSRAREAYALLGQTVDSFDGSLFPGDSRTLWTELSADLRKAARAGAQASNIDVARINLKDASEAIISLERSFGHWGKDAHRLTFCPMAFENQGASWLQTTEAIRNPYFGAEMLECGVIKEQFPSRQGDR